MITFLVITIISYKLLQQQDSLPTKILRKRSLGRAISWGQDPSATKYSKNKNPWQQETIAMRFLILCGLLVYLLWCLRLGWLVRCFSSTWWLTTFSICLLDLLNSPWINNWFVLKNIACNILGLSVVSIWSSTCCNPDNNCWNSCKQNPKVMVHWSKLTCLKHWNQQRYVPS